MERYKDIRKTMYQTQFGRWADLINLKAPYTFIKSLYYMETASLFLFLTQKIIKSPNLITLLYMVTGVIGAFLINSSQVTLVYIGIFMIFTKGTFDWADGPLARRLNKTSFIGHALDSYGAYISDIAFRISFVYFTLSYFPKFMFLFPAVSLILLATDFRIFANSLYIGTNLNNEATVRSTEFEEKLRDKKNLAGISKWYFLYESFLDARSRNIDFLLLILLFDVAFGYNFQILLLVLSALILLRSTVKFVASVYFVFNTYKEN